MQNLLHIFYSIYIYWNDVPKTLNTRLSFSYATNVFLVIYLRFLSTIIIPMMAVTHKQNSPLLAKTL